jgi:hypothetical protein
MSDQRKYDEDEKILEVEDGGLIFLFSAALPCTNLSAFLPFSHGNERYCRINDALLLIHEVPDWNFGPQSSHRDSLSLVTIHIYSGVRRYTIYPVGIQPAVRQVVLCSLRPHW